MTLNFQQYPIGQDERRPSWQEAVLDPISQGFGTIAQISQQRRMDERQRMLEQYARDKEAREIAMEQAKFNAQYGAPISPDVMSVGPQATARTGRSIFMPGGQGQVAQPTSLVSQFNQWRAGGMQPAAAQPEFMPALGMEARKQYQEQFRPQEQSKPQDTMTPYQAASIELEREKLSLARGRESQKAQGIQEKEQVKQNAAIEQANRIIGKVDQALEKVSPYTSGYGSVFSSIPATKAKNLANDLETIKANLGFAELQAMRQASPTGGALGQIAVQELNALQATVASLNQSQSSDQLISNLNEIKDHYQKWLNTIQSNQSTLEFGSIQEAEAANLPPGTRIKINGKWATVQ